MAGWKKAVLKSFNEQENTATIAVSGSGKVYLEGVTVARNIPPTEMVVNRQLAVLFFDDHNVKDGVIVAVY
ncbi:MAG TPA: hypothetical protein VEI27_01820 [Dehalococcoidales bacterium]|nr:hypothetical protein [Dehalococcoidales bacterium]